MRCMEASHDVTVHSAVGAAHICEYYTSHSGNVNRHRIRSDLRNLLDPSADNPIAPDILSLFT